MSQQRKLLAVICPVYGEEETVPKFYERFRAVFSQLPQHYDYNLIFVDNGSTDGTRQRVKEIIGGNARVFLIALSKNFGYQRSVECGLRTARGDLYQIIDVDCEDPPEMILQFLEEHANGYDIVYGLRAHRDEPWLIRQFRKLFYRLTRFVADENFVLDMAEFSLITREVRDAILQENNSFPFIRASIGRIGFAIKGIPYRREQRIAGETHYNLGGMLVFAVAGILSSTTLFLRIPVYALPVWVLAMAAVGVAGVYAPGAWSLPTLLALGFIFCGLTLTTISIYVARIYKNSLMRPNYVINRRESVLQD